MNVLKTIQRRQLKEMCESIIDGDCIYFVALRDSCLKWEDLPMDIQNANRIIFLDCYSNDYNDKKIEEYLNFCFCLPSSEIKEFIHHQTTKYIACYFYYENAQLQLFTHIEHSDKDGFLPSIPVSFQDFADYMVGQLDILCIYYNHP